MIRIGLLVFCFFCITGAASGAEPASGSDVTAKIRASLEEQFRASTGLGFATFECDLPKGSPPGPELICEAIDEEGEHFFYRITSGPDGGAPLVRVSQPVAQLNAEGREKIERPCLAFIAAFERGAWDEAYQQLSPELRASLSLPDMKAALAPLREIVGRLRVVEARTYATPSAGFHELEYSLGAKGGDAVARFRLRFTDDGHARIVAFLVTAKPGSALQAVLLSNTGQQVLAPLFDQSVERIDGPLADLERIGDAIEGQAVLADGTKVAIRVEQHGTAHDLDGNDYRFQVLDVPWLIRRYLVSTGAKPRRVDCPVRTAPDGGRVDCIATLEDGSERPISVLRHGGNHRLLKPK